MPFLNIPQSGLSLGSSRCGAKQNFVQPDIFSLSLADNVIEDMIKCVRSGKSIQLCLGKDPKILHGSKSQQLAASSDPFTHELYRVILSSGTPPSATTTPQSLTSNTVDFWGKVKRKCLSARIRGVRLSTDGSTRVIDHPPVRAKSATNPLNNSPIAGADAALAALKISLASEDARKKDNTTKYVKDSLPPAGKKRGTAPPAKTTNKARFLSQNNKCSNSATTRSVPTSPALIGVASPSLALTSVPLSQQQAEKAKATRRPIIHKLALGPASGTELLNDKPSDLSESEFKSALDKVADLENGKWVLKSKAFKELEVFSYGDYSAGDRQVAIENAIRAYDKLRLNAAEPEWERLLPQEERGTGKCLSKLQAKIAGGGIQPVKTPKISVHRAEDSGRDTPINMVGDNPSDKPSSNASTQGSENMTRSYSNPGATKLKRVSEKEAQAKRLLAKPGRKAAKSGTLKTSEKKSLGKESAKIKSSEYVGDSDDEDDSSLIPLTAATTMTSVQASITKAMPKPAVKHIKEEIGEQNLTSVTKKPRAPSNISSQKPFPFASSPPTNISDMDESSSSNNSSLKRKAASSTSSDEPVTKRHQTSSISSDETILKCYQKSGSSSSSSVNSTEGSHQSGCRNGNRVNTTRMNVKEKYAHIPQAQRALNAHKFNAFYKSYKQLHLELSMMKTKDKLKMAELLEMQDRLTKLKKEVLKGSDGGVGE